MIKNTRGFEHRRIALLGVTRHTDNYGVRVLLSSAVEVLASAEPEADIIVLDYGKEPDCWSEKTSQGNRGIRLVNLRFSWRLHLPNNIFRLIVLAAFLRLIHGKLWIAQLIGRNPWLDEILKTETFYSIAGGDSFSDIYGLRRFIYIALPQVLVLLLGKPLILWPQTFGPFKGRVSKYLARRILLRAICIFSRDSEGVGTVRELTGQDRPVVQVAPDLGFCMAPEKVEDGVLLHLEGLRRRGPIVGFNPSSLLYIGGYTGKNMFRLREPFPDLLSALVKHVILELGAQVLLIPHVCGGPQSQEDETRLCKKLMVKYSLKLGGRIHYLDQGFSHQQIKTIIGRCDMFIGARMHACIGAVSQGVPTVCLAYSKKFSGVMSPLGTGALVIDLRKKTIPEVLVAASEVFKNRSRLSIEVKALVSEAKKRSILVNSCVIDTNKFSKQRAGENKV